MLAFLEHTLVQVKTAGYTSKLEVHFIVFHGPSSVEPRTVACVVSWTIAFLAVFSQHSKDAARCKVTKAQTLPLLGEKTSFP
jgi:hypothetical protein